MTDASADVKVAASQIPRIEAQYLQAAVQFWTNLNIVIWQRLAYLAIFQTGAIYFAVSHHHTWFAGATVMLALVLSIAIVFQTISDQNVRTELTRQCNFIACELLQPFFAERSIPKGLKIPFQLYDLNLDRARSGYGLVRHHWGSRIVMVVLLVLDGSTILICSWPGSDAWRDPLLHMLIYR